MNNLQQQLLKAKWYCKLCNNKKIIWGKFKPPLVICKRCQGTGIQPQIFDNEFISGKFGGFTDDGKFDKGVDIKIPRYKSGDKLFLCRKCERIFTFALANLSKDVTCPKCQSEITIFKVLRTLENNSKIEVVKI